MGVCNCSMFYCTLLYVHYSFAIILMGKRELVALLILSSWYLVMVVWLFLAVPWVCLRFVIMVFPDLTNLLFLTNFLNKWNYSLSKKEGKGQEWIQSSTTLDPGYQWESDTVTK